MRETERQFRKGCIEVLRFLKQTRRFSEPGLAGVGKKYEEFQ